MAESVAGRYRIIDSLGSGGMGEVFLAEDSKLRRKVALKKLASTLDSNLDVRRRLLHEARAAARINHPNIASIYDVIDTDDGAYIVMEYVPGETLATRLGKGPLPVRDVIAIALQAVDAINAAHSQGVVHGDLKPANLHLMPDGNVKILDFGLARTLRFESSVDTAETTSSAGDLSGQPGALAGTLPYMPPEAFEGRVADQRGDIYSLGVTLFELLTGRRPFTGDSRLALILAITTHPTPRAIELSPEIPAPLSALIGRAMARLPEDRYRTASELLEELRSVSKGKSRLIRTLVLMTTLGLGGVVAFLISYRKPDLGDIVRPATVVAVLPFLSFGPDSNATYIASGMTDVLGTNLASLPLAIVPPGQASRYGSPDRDVTVLTRELGASMVIDGSVHKYGDQLRVTVRLIRAGSGKLDWSRTFDGDLSAVLGLQEEVLGGIAEGLTRTGLLDAESEAPHREQLTRLPTADEEAYADYIQARSFLDRKDVPENVPRAITLFESAWQKDTTFVQALGGLGEAYWAQYWKTRDSNWAEMAMEATRRAVSKAPANMAVRYSLSVILEGTGKYHDAIEELTRIIAAQPDNDMAHSALGGVYEKLDLKVDAQREFTVASRLRPAYWWHHWRLAIHHFGDSRFEPAAIEALRVTELQPDNPRGFQLLGTVYQAQGRLDDALRAYEKCLKLSPTASAYSNIGGLHFDRKNYSGAVEFYEKAVELDPKLPVFRRNLGDALLEFGRKDQAHENYVHAIKLTGDVLAVNPGDSNTMALRALCQAKAGESDSALQTIEQAVRMNPKSNYVLYKQTAVYTLLDRKADALKSLKSALAAGASAREAAKDPDLRTIAGTSEFNRLVSM